jgi:hypothetical protein
MQISFSKLIIDNRSIVLEIVLLFREDKLINRVVEVVIEFRIFLKGQRLTVSEPHLQPVLPLETQSIIILLGVFGLGKTLLYLVCKLHLDPAEKLYLDFNVPRLQITQV